MNLQDITTWTISSDHKARPKNPYQIDPNRTYPLMGEDNIKRAHEAFEEANTQHIYTCSPSLVAGDYPAEDVELVWQRFAYGTWLNNYTEPSEDQMFNSRQYLQLKQPS